MQHTLESLFPYSGGNDSDSGSDSESEGLYAGSHANASNAAAVKVAPVAAPIAAPAHVTVAQNSEFAVAASQAVANPNAATFSKKKTVIFSFSGSLSDLANNVEAVMENQSLARAPFGSDQVRVSSIELIGFSSSAPATLALTMPSGLPSNFVEPGYLSDVGECVVLIPAETTRSFETPIKLFAGELSPFQDSMASRYGVVDFDNIENDIHGLGPNSANVLVPIGSPIKEGLAKVLKDGSSGFTLANIKKVDATHLLVPRQMAYVACDVMKRSNESTRDVVSMSTFKMPFHKAIVSNSAVHAVHSKGIGSAAMWTDRKEGGSEKQIKRNFVASVELRFTFEAPKKV